ncbi:lysine--tRNA ligase [Microgenomates group bacterium]|nr:lysine--tRNA ligase [Microgenomates group bacterium]
MSRLDEARSAKIAKLRALEEKGINPFPYSFAKTQMVKECLALEGEEVQTAGRLFSWRAQGKVVFADLGDLSGKIQILLHASKFSEETWEQLKLVDVGDFLGVKGEVGKTKTGQITIMAEEFTFLGKALRPLPSEWNAAEDKEARFRARHLDLLVNERSQKILAARWTILREMRSFLHDQGFTEVETPILQPLYGGTNARPFITHMKALDSDFYLRIAPELYLKRLMVGGEEKIFEIARNFRNEGIDQTHQPEFTMIEWYEAYADYHRVTALIEEMLKFLNKKVNGGEKLMVGDREVDLGRSFARMTLKESLSKYAGLEADALEDEELGELLKKNSLKLIGDFSRGKAIFALFEKLVCHQLIEPTWIIDYPREVSPLAKPHRSDEGLVERFELYIGGKELSDGWSELTNPLEQRERFEEEQARMRAGDAEAQPLDEDFLAAMEYGLPPMGGMGMGIDRLVMLLTNMPSIKEVIAFPTLRRAN